jgi:exopolysaccharide biosynthesis polyprenyl glycosylphosphotransferase
MKKSELLFSFLLVPLDYLMIVLAGVTAYYIRFADITTKIRPAMFDLNFSSYIQGVLIIGLIWLFVFAFSGLYNIREARKVVREFYRVASACSTGLMLVVILIFLRREFFDSRFIVLVAWILSIIFITASRVMVRILQRYLYRHDIGVKKIILVGDSKTSDVLMQEFSSKSDSGIEVIKRVRKFNLEISNELSEFLKFKKVDEVIQSDPSLSKAEILRLFDFADENHITFKYAADLLGTKVLKTEVMEMAGVPIVEVKKTTLDGWGRIAKRLFDIVISALIIILISPILIATAILIKIDSRGPIFFSKKDDNSPLCRVGQGGKPFHYLKFRSMMPKSDNLRYTELADQNVRDDGPMVKIKNDPRVTRIGKIIRRWSIDELPELFLVLVGSMSLVGPRPHLPEEVAKYEHHHKKVLTIKPGMTGMAQISGRSDLSFEEEVKLDTYYIENWSLSLDLSLLIRTPWAVLRGRQAE